MVYRLRLWKILHHWPHYWILIIVKCQNFLYLSHSFQTLFFLLSYKQMAKSTTVPYWDVTFSWYLGRFTCTVREALNFHVN